MALAFDTEPTFTPGAVTELFDMAPYHTLQPARRIAVAPDGQRFLMTTAAGGAEGTSAAAQIIAVQNWFEDLRQLVPTD